MSRHMFARCGSIGARRQFGAACWEISNPTFGKSTVTGELWRKRAEGGSSISAHFDTVSTHGVTYRFSESIVLRDEYVGPTGRILIGRLLEDLDAFAGNIAADWCSEVVSSTGEPVMLVTAAVDAIRLEEHPSVKSDAVLNGSVIWTGSSSMLVRMRMRSGLCQSGKQLLEADFVYVARDRGTMRSIKVPPMVPATPSEQESFDDGRRKTQLKREARQSLEWRNLSAEMRETLMALIAEGVSASDFPALPGRFAGKVLMSSTSLESTVVTKPRHTNTAGRVFGGFLMRQCYEQAYSACFLFGARLPRCLDVSEFLFQRPVPMGCLLRLQSRVVLTLGTQCFVEVLVRAILPNKAESFRVNKVVVKFETGGEALPQVLPTTKDEGRAQLAAFENAQLNWS